jgi:ELWxxDGT repeat protein
MSLVKDLVAGAVGSFPEHLTNVNGTLYFSATNAATGRELWKSNGTAAGTTLVKDIQTGSASSNPVNLTNVNGTVFFNAYDDIHGYSLWKSDSTAAGTVFIKDPEPDVINPGVLFKSTTGVGDTLYFKLRASGLSHELWKSDGTAAGTVKVDLGLQEFESVLIDNPLIGLGGGIYFLGNRDSVVELWKSDGTKAGTSVVKQLPLGIRSVDSFININGTLYIGGAGYNDDGQSIWKSDGTTAGTVLVKNQLSANGNSGLTNFTSVNNSVYFKRYIDGAVDLSGTELWKSDGTAAGTVLLKTFFASRQHSVMTNVNGTLYFSAADATHGLELWKSDGTVAGTVQVSDIRSGAAGSEPLALTNVNGTLYFTADDGVHGRELWKSDGTAAGTRLAGDIRSGSMGSNPTELTNVNGKLYFTADDGVNGRELWSADNLPTSARSEIFWRNSQTNLSVVWNSENTTQLVAGRLLTYGTGAGANLAGKPVLYDRSWRLVNTIDMNGDRVPDLVYARDGEIRVLTVGQVNGQTTTVEADREFTFASTKFGSANGKAAKPDAGWELVGVEDMTGDGQGDFVFYSRGLDLTVVWQTNSAGQIVDGGGITSAVSPGGQHTGAPNDWKVEALGDFTGDGKIDILWRNTANVVVLWELNGTQLSYAKSGVLPSLGRNFQVKGVGDFNHDGVKDIVWRDQTNNVNRIWTFGTNGRPTEVNLLAAASSQWEIGDVADMNGDGTTDLIWRNNAENNVVIWNIKDAALSLPGSGYLLNYLPGGNRQVINPGGIEWTIDAVTAAA